MFIKRKIQILKRKKKKAKSILKANNVTKMTKKKTIKKLPKKWRKELRLSSVFYILRNSVS